jgi:hypothetical protein
MPPRGLEGLGNEISGSIINTRVLGARPPMQPIKKRNARDRNVFIDMFTPDLE